MGDLKRGADPEALRRGKQWDLAEMWKEGLQGNKQTQETPLLWDTPGLAPSLARACRWVARTSTPQEQASGADISLSSSSLTGPQ